MNYEFFTFDLQHMHTNFDLRRKYHVPVTALFQVLDCSNNEIKRWTVPQ